MVNRPRFLSTGRCRASKTPLHSPRRLTPPQKRIYRSALMCIVDDGRGTACRAPTVERFGQPISGSLPTIIRSFKSAVTQRINKLWKTSHTWQRNYYEHIISDEHALTRIRKYIADNPGNGRPTRIIPTCSAVMICR